MRLYSFESDGGARTGVEVAGSMLLDLAAADRAGGGEGTRYASMLGIIESGPSALQAIDVLVRSATSTHTLPLDSVSLLSPIPVPARLRDAGMFVEHLEIIRRELAKMAARGAPDPEAAATALLETDQFKLPEVVYRRCCYYNGNHHAVIGPDAPLAWPRESEVLDYELEIGVVVGRAGHDLTPEEAEECVFGYTLMNDWSARDLQVDVAKSGAGPCMGKDFATSLGPCIVTADEIGDPHDIELSAWVEGEQWSAGSTRNMHHGVFEAISQFSRISPLVAGEVIGTGTCAYGSATEQGKRLQPGQTVELRAPGIGSLRNTIKR